MKVTLRRAVREDIPHIIAFYVKEGGKYILPRSARELQEAVDHGVIFLFLEGLQIVAASGMFVIRVRKEVYFEYGGTVVAPPFRGFDLQDIFTAARFCYGVLFYPEALPARVYTFIKPDNEASHRNIVAMGFIIKHEAPAPYMKPCRKCKSRPSLIASRICCYDIYGVEMDAIKYNIKYFLDASADRTNSKGAQLEITSTLFRDARQRAILWKFIS